MLIRRDTTPPVGQNKQGLAVRVSAATNSSRIQINSGRTFRRLALKWSDFSRDFSDDAVQNSSANVVAISIFGR